MSKSRVIAAAAIAIAISQTPTLKAYADPDSTLTTGGSGGDQANAAMIVGRGGRLIKSVPLMKGTGGTTRQWICHYYDLPSMASQIEDIQPVNPQDKFQYVFICIDAKSGEEVRNQVVTYNASDPAASLGNDGAIAATIDGAVSRIRALPPTVATSPPRDRPQLVGVRTWFWIDRWDAPSDPQTVAGYRISVAADDAEIDINPDDGTGTLTCDETTAIPWSVEETRESRCTHAFHRSHTYNVTVTLRYRHVRWVAQDGAGNVIDGGDLDPIISAPAAVPLLVQDAQAVIN